MTQHHRAIETTLVRLKKEGYSVDAGTLGLVDRQFSSLNEETIVAVTWVGKEQGQYRSSANVVETDLEAVGVILIRIPDEIIDEEIARSAIDIPDELVTRRAEALIAETVRSLRMRQPVV
jgi:hypothetical protein